MTDTRKPIGYLPREALAGFERSLRMDGFCPDTGKCHHACDERGPCWRRDEAKCVPLSISGLDDAWRLPVYELEDPT